MTDPVTLVEGIRNDVVSLRTQNDQTQAELRSEIAELRTALASLPQASKPQVELKTRKDHVDFLKRVEGFKTFVREGGNGAEFEFRADALTSNTNGVYPQVDSAVGRVIHDTSPLYNLITHVTLGNGAPYTKVFNKNDATAGRIAETGSRTGTDSNTTYKVEIKAPEVYASPKISKAAKEDSFYDVEGEVLFSGLDKIGRIIAGEILNGTGFSNEESAGVLTFTQQVVTGDHTVNRIDRLNVLVTASASAIDEDDLLNLEGALPQAYQGNAGWLMNNRTATAIRKLEGADGRKLWEDSLQKGQPPMLLGYPVYISPDMPSVGTETLPILFGDFKQGITMATRVGLSVSQDDFKNLGYTTYYVRGRMGSSLTDGRALVALKMKAAG